MACFPTFDVESDYDVYCYLRANLPPGYDVTAKPSKEYYSEWHFNYEVLVGGEVIRRFAGDFRTIPKGSLAEEAREFVASIRRDRKG